MQDTSIIEVAEGPVFHERRNISSGTPFTAESDGLLTVLIARAAGCDEFNIEITDPCGHVVEHCRHHVAKAGHTATITVPVREGELAKTWGRNSLEHEMEMRWLPVMRQRQDSDFA